VSDRNSFVSRAGENPVKRLEVDDNRREAESMTEPLCSGTATRAAPPGNGYRTRCLGRLRPTNGLPLAARTLSSSIPDRWAWASLVICRSAAPVPSRRKDRGPADSGGKSSCRRSRQASARDQRIVAQFQSRCVSSHRVATSIGAVIVTGPIILPLWQHYESQVRFLYTCYAHDLGRVDRAATPGNLSL
jgi:hypothetical protein